ncbi:hypothetical protein APS67_000405 [Streptomyces sp. AVP053U2]|nr:hypothetical protein APS67_000405 [Streptomyces sp. AVP053U2]
MVSRPGPAYPHPLPGAVGLSHLGACGGEAADGVCGGSPHLHLVCTEAYVVTAGRGAVQTLSPDGYRDIPLRPGSVARFTPGTVHRMVRDGARGKGGDGTGGGDHVLRITVLMQNSGLPEAGDAVLVPRPTFSPTRAGTPPPRLCRPARVRRRRPRPGAAGTSRSGASSPCARRP